MIPLGFKKRADLAGGVSELRGRQRLMDGQAQDSACLSFRHGQVAFFVAQTFGALLQVDGDGVVDLRLDAVFGKIGLQLVPTVCLDDEKMVGALFMRQFPRTLD